MPLDGSTYGVREGLLRVRELLEREGWCQGRWRGPEGEHCVVDAIRSTTDVYGSGFLAVWGILERRLGDSVMNWQDAPGRTKEEVLALIDAAIADAVT